MIYFFRIIKYWGFKNFLKILFGEIFFYFNNNNFYYEKSLKYNSHVPTPKYILDDIFQNINLNPDDKIIDLGSGTGRIIYYLAKKNFTNLIGVELSKNLINIAKKNKNFEKKKITFYNKNFLNFKMPTDTKAVFIYDPAGKNAMEKLFFELKKNLKKNSIIVYITPIYLKNLKNYNFKIILKKTNKHNRGYCIFKKK